MSIWTFTLSLSGALIFWCYNGCFISFLAVEEVKPPFSDVPDLIHHPKVKLLLVENGLRFNQLNKAAQHNPDIGKLIEQNVVLLNLSTRIDDFKAKFVESVDRQNVVLPVSELTMSQILG